LVDCLSIACAAEVDAVLGAVDSGGLWCVAALDFELGYLLEPATAPAGWTPPAGRPLARFWRFSRRVEMDADAATAWLGQCGAQQAAGVGGIAASIDQKQYESAVDRISRYIAAGDCYQVNFTFPLTFQWFGSPAALYARLREQQPVRYGGFVGDAAGGIVSLSPELFIEKTG
jgi:para-aminobenzoate synthetase/4-amino-4-deoxychorismate lyase